MSKHRPTPAQAARLRRLLAKEAKRRQEPALAEQDEKAREQRQKLATLRYLREEMMAARRAGEPVSPATRQLLQEGGTRQTVRRTRGKTKR